MSSPISKSDENPSLKNGENTSRDKNLSSNGDESFLRFIPSQIDVVHKRIKIDSQASPLKHRSTYSPITVLETQRDRHGKSSTSRSSTSEISSVSARKMSFSTRESHSSTYKYEITLNSDTPNSSVYITPEGTPSEKTPDLERRRSQFKRSLSDEFKDESYSSSNSSFNKSSYYTPESSPSTYNSAKRLKTRWSDGSSFSLDTSTSVSWSHETSDSANSGEIQPELIGYQLVGDSQFCRFGQQLLGLRRVPMPNSPGRIGICVSGQTITDLHRRVRENFYPISDKIILMIGTNDFLRNVDVETMCEELSALIKTLQKTVSTIILLTLPPIPKLEKKQHSTHFKLLDVYNNHIRSLGNGDNLKVADISPLYMGPSPYQRCRMQLFEVYFAGPARRLDLIHLNKSGLEIIRKYILDKFL